MGIPRKQAEDYVLQLVDELTPGSKNRELYTVMFKRMSEKEFRTFMQGILNGKNHLQVVVEPADTNMLNTERNLKIADKYGIKMFQKLTYGEHGSKKDGTYVPANEVKIPRLIIDTPIRRPSQLLTKGISTAKDNKSRDALSGQVTGDSKSAKLTQPEREILSSLGLKYSLIELDKYRGGDEGGSRAMDMALDRNGEVSQEQIEPYATGVVSLRTMNIIFRSCMIDTNFSEKDKKIQ